VSEGSAPIRILAVDDHVLVRQGIAVLISTEPDLTLVAEASNGREAIQQFRGHRPDITLMDLQMPEMNGFDAIIAIRAALPERLDLAPLGRVLLGCHMQACPEAIKLHCAEFINR
jgi:DNA-binding NarL/FixJ family response regulator